MRLLSRELFTLCVVALLMSVFLAAAGQATLAKPVKQGHELPTLRLNSLAGLGGSSWVPTLDPALPSDSYSLSVLNLIHANLVKLGANGAPEPDLATWRLANNHRTYTFIIRRNARFSNGDYVTAHDVVFSLTRALAKHTNSPVAMTYLGHIVGAARLNDGKTDRLQGVRPLGPRRVQITVDRPIAFFLGTLTYATGSILDARIMARRKPQAYLTNTCAGNVGAGPFTFKCRNSSSNIHSFYPSGRTPTVTLVPNRYYYGKHPRYTIAMPVIANTETNYAEYRAGGIDMTGIPSAYIVRERRKPGFFEAPSSLVEFLTPDEDSAPFKNVHCRLAVAYAINQSAINNKVLNHSQLTIHDVVPRGFLGYYAGKNNPHYNPARARQELSKCPGGIHGIQVPYAKNSSDLTAMMRAMQNMWAAVGIKISLKPLTFGDWIDVGGQPLIKTHTAIFQNNWIADYPDPQDYCTLLLHSRQAKDIGDFRNHRFDRLDDQADVTFNRKLRAQLYIKAQHIALSQGAWIPVGQGVAYGLVKPYVHGFVVSPVLGGLVPRGDSWGNVTISKH